MSGCRDCVRCTEAGILSLIFFIPRLFWQVLTSWNIGLFLKKCPQCGHRMRVHQRKADGSFQD
jgi:hypothetical protein